jgi:curved DNA-binding protein CbpA
MESPFAVLGVDPDADEATVERAYQRRVKETHPDHGGSPEAFQRVRRAYEALQDGYRPGDETPTPDPSSEQRPPESDVEYLDYDVLVDHGWSLDDEDLFERAAAADLEPHAYGRFTHQPDRSLLEGAERCEYTWPYACRGGACANCAVAVVDGELSQPVDHILPPELLDRGIRLSCVGKPITDELQVVFNVKHLPDLEELLLPASRFENATLTD